MRSPRTVDALQGHAEGCLTWLSRPFRRATACAKECGMALRASASQVGVVPLIDTQDASSGNEGQVLSPGFPWVRALMQSLTCACGKLFADSRGAAVAQRGAPKVEPARHTHRRRTLWIWFLRWSNMRSGHGLPDPSGPHRESGRQEASWASGLSPDLPSLVTITTSDICSASGAFLVTDTDGFRSPSVGRCCLWAVFDSVRRRHTGRHASGTTFGHYRVAYQTDRRLQVDRPSQRAILCMGESRADPSLRFAERRSRPPSICSRASTHVGLAAGWSQLRVRAPAGAASWSFRICGSITKRSRAHLL